MSYGTAGALGIAILSLTLGGCDRPDKSVDVADRDSKEPLGEPLSPSAQAKLDACLAKNVTPPWRLVRTQPITEHLSVTIEAKSDELGLPYRSIQMRAQQYVVFGFGQNSLVTIPSPEIRRADIARGALRPRNEVAGVDASDFAPFVPYENVGFIYFLNIPREEYCRYRHDDARFPNPFVKCWAKRGEYTASLSFPQDAVAHLPRLFVDARSLMSGVTSCFELTKQ